MKVKHRECREAETQLRMIEERLGMTPTQYNMPPSPATMLLTELSTPPARTATSRRAGARAAAAASASPNLSAPVVNGTSNTSGTASSSRTRRGPPVAAEDVRSSKRTRRWKEWTFFSFFWSRSSAWTVLCRHRTKKNFNVHYGAVDSADLPFVNDFTPSLVTIPLVNWALIFRKNKT